MITSIQQTTKKENTIKERQYMCEMCFFLFHSSDNPTSVRCPVCVSDLVTKVSD